ncbi:hypothetical protein [uncultured Jannaschia sp.]|uniref:hypothetical protein n=1 Tax=uncultured Jannaschia sp. TaxID=293347 RepID=UPI00262BA25B|nr:hypothetical protein [uncultured Jannaschia sp.]
MTTDLSRRAFAGLALGGLAGCAASDPLTEAPRDMGDFRLGLTIVVADKVKKIPPSRDATKEALIAAMTAEIDRRFRRYDGAREYHIAVAIDGYALAPPGIPIVLTPKSIMVVTANLWTADPQEKIRGPEQLTTFEGADTLLLGSGLVKSADEQLATLARNMSGKIQAWLLREPETFGLPPR